jgi:PTS system cellobiose-specific IIA component
MSEEELQAVMGLIINAGEAKSLAIEAIDAAKKQKFAEASKKIEDARESLLKAHHSQTNMITKEAQGNLTTVTLLIVHSQDHLMTAISFTDLAEEIIFLHEKLALNTKLEAN